MKRIRQIADKAFRPDKNDLLSEDLQKAEIRIELIKKTCESTSNKITACLLGHIKDEKRVHKVPEVILGMSMVENSKSLLASDDPSILGEVLGEAAKIELKLGNEFVNFELRIEQKILGPLSKILNQDLPNIYKLKKTLKALTESMEAAKAKLQQVNSRHSVSGAALGKIDNIKDDFEDTQLKVEQCRDNLYSEMYCLIARESEISNFIVQFLYFQNEYYKTISHIFNELLPDVETAYQNSMRRGPVYGVVLSEHLKCSNRSIAYPLELCVCGLLLTALKEEGLFRIAGGASKVKKLKSMFDAGLINLNGLLAEFGDPHVIGNALKCFLRELPIPLLTFHLYEDWVQAIRILDQKEKIDALKEVLAKMPKENFENLRYLVKFLHELSKFQGINKMSPANIAIVIGPNLLWCKSNPDDPIGDINPMGMNMTMTHYFSSILDEFINNCELFFPEESPFEFFITCTKPEIPLEDSGFKSGSNSSILSNGIDDGMGGEQDKIKRAQSTSSLEENSPPLGSPKPVLRRKNKPAPVPPSFVNKVSASPSAPPPAKDLTKSSTEVGKESSLEHKHSFKREGWVAIPPSPSQMMNKSFQQVRQSTFESPPNSKGIPPVKPPQPTLYQDLVKKPNEPPPKPASPLRYKSSFKERDQPHSPPESESPSKGSIMYSSLPRKFHTDNSFKGAQSPKAPPSPRPPNVFLASSTSLPPPPPPPVLAQSAQNQLKQVSPPEVHKNEKLEGGVASNTMQENVVQPSQTECKVEIKEDQRKIEKESKEGGERGEQTENQKKERERSSSEEEKSEINFKQPPPLIESRPVPMPRSSLLVQGPTKEKGDGPPLVRERPTLMAKPRDLSKRASGVNLERSSSTSGKHERKGSGTSGSSGESDNNNHENVSSSNPVSRSLSIHSSFEELEDGTNNKSDVKSSLTAPYRPPRPTPPSKRPPSADEVVASTDL